MKVLSQVFRYFLGTIETSVKTPALSSSESGFESETTPAKLSREEIENELGVLSLFEVSSETVSNVLKTLFRKIEQDEESTEYLLRKILDFAKVDYSHLSFCLSLIKQDHNSLFKDEREQFEFKLSTDFSDYLVDVILQGTLSPKTEYQSITDLAWEILYRSSVSRDLISAAIKAKDLITVEMIDGYVSNDENAHKTLCKIFRTFFAFLYRSHHSSELLQIKSLIELSLPLLRKVHGASERNWEIRDNVCGLVKLYASQTDFDADFFKFKVLPELKGVLHERESHSTHMNETFMRLLLGTPRLLATINPNALEQDKATSIIFGAEAALEEDIFQEKYLWLLEVFGKELGACQVGLEEAEKVGLGRISYSDVLTEQQQREFGLRQIDYLLDRYVKLFPSVCSPKQLLYAIRKLNHSPSTKLNLDEKIISFLQGLNLELNKDWEIAAYLFSLSKPEWGNANWVAMLLMLLEVKPPRDNDYGEKYSEKMRLYFRMLEIVEAVDSETLDLALEILPKSEKARERLVSSLLWAAAHCDVVYERSFFSKESEPVRTKGLTNGFGKEILLKHAIADWFFDILISKIGVKDSTASYSRSIINELKPLAEKFGMERILSLITENDLPFASMLLRQHFELSSLTTDQVTKLLKDLVLIKTQDYTEAYRARSGLFEKLRKAFPAEFRAVISPKASLAEDTVRSERQT